MFKLDGDVLMVNLPTGRTQRELVREARTEIQRMVETGKLYGKDLKVTGRITTGMAMMMGHELAHVCKSVSIFDPKENEYIRVISH